jgi:hypothetical protein
MLFSSSRSSTIPEAEVNNVKLTINMKKFVDAKSFL